MKLDYENDKEVKEYVQEPNVIQNVDDLIEEYATEEADGKSKKSG
jgi:hypothetical protein